MEDAAEGYDTKYDASKMMNPNLNLYTIVNGERLAINAMPFVPESMTVQLGFSTALAGLHKFQFDDISILNFVNLVYLKDNYLGTLTQIETFSDYTFNSQVGTYNDRFELVFGNTMTDIERAKSTLANFTVNPNPVIGDEILVNVTDRSERVELTLADLLGREVFTKTFAAGETIRLAKPNVSGQYLIKVKTPTSLHTKSVIVR